MFWFSFLNVARAAAGGTWTQATASAGWSGRLLASTAVFNNAMWIMGGAGPSYGNLNDVWYSGDGVNWTRATAAAGWGPRVLQNTLVFNGLMWVIQGAQYGGSVFNDVWSSPDGVNWTQTTASATNPARWYQSALVYNNKMWIMGGLSDSCCGTYLNDVWSSSDGVTWTQVTPAAAFSGRYWAGTTVFNNKMWIMGGDAPAWANDVWFSSDGVTWTQATAHAAWGIRDAMSTPVFDNKMWIIGGYGFQYAGQGGGLADTWSSPDGVTWTRAGSLPWGGRWDNSNVGLVFKNNMWMMSGNLAQPGYTWIVPNDVWYSQSDVWNP